MEIKIDHIAIWTKDLEKVKDFYVRHFDMVCSEKYHNPAKQFTSFFLSFRKGNVRIELMHRPDIHDFMGKKGMVQGMAHFAVSVGSKESVNQLTDRLRAENVHIESEPRTTGDGFYESVILDIEGNCIEITE